jgi:hypothetical protein
MSQSLLLSNLPHTWLIDLDGCVFRHNSHLCQEDILLPGVQDFWKKIPLADTIIVLTARSSHYANETKAAMARFELRYDQIIFDLPVGERILVNDRKPRGLSTALSINLERDVGLGNIRLEIEEDI